MYLTYKEFDKIFFPVYRLVSDNVISDSKGILSVDGVAVDDKNAFGKTLGQRRLTSTYEGSFLKLRSAIPDIISLVKRGAGTYIDFKGRVFIYRKTKYLRLKYYRIDKVIQQGTYSLIQVAEFPTKWEVPRPPPHEYPYIGILLLKDSPFMLYEYSKTREKEARRKI